MTKPDRQNWTVASAKAQFAQVMDQAQVEPQTISRNGKPSVVVVSVEEWERKTSRRGSLATFLLASPLAGSAIDTERLQDGWRKTEF